MSRRPRTPERGIPRSTEKEKENWEMWDASRVEPGRAVATESRAEGERQRGGHPKTGCRDQEEERN